MIYSDLYDLYQVNIVAEGWVCTSKTKAIQEHFLMLKHGAAKNKTSVLATQLVASLLSLKKV